MKVLINCSDSLLGRFIGGRLSVDGHDVTLVKKNIDMATQLDVADFDLVVVVVDYRFTESEVLMKYASKGVRFFVLSNLQDEYSIYSAYEAGVTSYMSLPLDFSKFLLKVRELA